MKIRVMSETDSSVVLVVEEEENENQDTGDTSEVDGSEPGAGDTSGIDSSGIDGDGEDVVSAAQVVDSRPFLTTPLDDYTVTEGMLLILVVMSGLLAVVRLFGGRR